MPSAFNQLFGDFFARRGGDYQTLLAYGSVWRDDIEDREGWRRQIRAQARRDCSGVHVVRR